MVQRTARRGLGTLKTRATVFGTLATDGWAVTFGTAMRGLGTLNPRASLWYTGHLIGGLLHLVQRTAKRRLGELQLQILIK